MMFRSLLCLTVFLLSVFILEVHKVPAQELKVGDTIRVEVLGETITTQVTGVNRQGLVQFNVNVLGNIAPMTLPMSQVQRVGAPQQMDPPELRTWTSAGGGFAIKATLKKHVGSIVTLVKEDGSEVKVNVNKLCDEDQTYLNNLKNPQAAPREPEVRNGEADPFGGPPVGDADSPGGRTGGRGMAGRFPPNFPPGQGGFDGEGFGGENERLNDFRERITGGGDATGGYETKRLSFSGADTFKSGSKIKPGLAPWLPGNVANANIPFEYNSGGSPLHENFSRIVISRDGRFLAIAGNNPLSSRQMVFVFDLNARTAVIQKEFRGREMVPLAFSADGKTLVIRHSFAMGFNSSILFWEVDVAGHDLKFKKGWTVEDAPDAGAFVDAGRLATLSNQKAVLFDVQNDKPLNYTKVSPANGVIGSVVGAETFSDQFIVDAGSGTRYPFSTGQNWGAGLAAISPDVRLLATGHRGALGVVDLTNGKRLLEFTPLEPGEGMFVTNRYLLVGSHLYDLKLASPIARIETSDLKVANCTADGRAAYVAQRRRNSHSYSLVITELLTPELRQQADRYTTGNPISIAPGTGIAVNISGITPRDQGKLEARIQERGLKIVANSDFVLNAVVNRLPRESRDVNLDVRGVTKTMRVNFTPTESVFELTYRGEKIWGQTRLNKPGTQMQGKPGENPQTTANRLCQANPSFFINASFPTNLTLYTGDLPTFTLNQEGLH